MASVWIIEQGSYSDYSVRGVFSTKENAELVADAINKTDPYDKATVDERPLDPGAEELRQGLSQFHVVMLRDGTVEKCEKNEISGYAIATNGEANIWRRSQASGKFHGPDALSCSVWARDETHAVKIANERRAQMIATNDWP